MSKNHSATKIHLGARFKTGLILMTMTMFAFAAFTGFSLVHANASRVQTARPETIFVGTNVGAIPDNDCTGPGRQINFAVTGITTPISNVRVSFTGTHTFVGDLDVRLIAPDTSTSAFIFTFVGNNIDPNFGDSSDLNGTYNFFDMAVNNFSAAAAAVGPTTPIPPGDYRSSDVTGANTSLDPVFANLAVPNGTWILKFNDCAQGDTGTIIAATLSLNGPATTPTPTPTPTVTPTPTPTVSPTPTPTPGPNPNSEGDINRFTVGVPGIGDGFVDVRDSAQFDRFANGLDCPQTTPNEFQRYDDGPLPTLGDGRITSSDRTQLDRYIAGLDPLRVAGGPTNPITVTCTATSRPDEQLAPDSDSSAAARITRLVSSSGNPGTDVTVFIDSDAQGDEVATQYSLHFDPSVLAISNNSGANPDVTLGGGVSAGTTMTVNATQAANGHLGIFENFNGGGQGAISAGTKRITSIKFHILPGAAFGTTPIIFDDGVIAKVTSDPYGIGLGTTYDQNGVVTILDPSAAVGVTVSGRVVSPDGRGLRNATVTLADQNGVTRTVTTSSFGYYSFDDVAKGQVFVVQVSSRLFRFVPRVLQVTDNIANVDFVGLE